MIISAAPFRISFAGGSSDIPCFYRRNPGAVLSTTIDKYIYVSVHPYFNRQQTKLKYSETECVDQVQSIRHPIIRAALLELLPRGGVEIVSTADVPSCSGLGSSSTFTVALYHALYSYVGASYCSKGQLARKACEVEIERLGEPNGKQDQYAAAYGGLNFIEFSTDGSVSVTPLLLSQGLLEQLEANLMLFYLGAQRRARDVLADQNARITNEKEKFDALCNIVALAYGMRDALLRGDLRAFAYALAAGWELKCSLSPAISNDSIDEYYTRALNAGALGGKLAGAGGAGFLLLYVEPPAQEQVRAALADCFELPFKFDRYGSRIIHVSDNQPRGGFIHGPA